MLKPFYRQRRRILLLTAFLAMCLWKYIIDSGGLRFLVKNEYEDSYALFWISIVLAIASISLALGILISYVVPGLRRLIEALIITILLTEVVLYLAQFVTGAPLAPWAITVWYVAIFFVTFGRLDHQPASRKGLRFTYRAKVSRRINATPDAIWAAVVTDADTIGTYWSQTLDTVEPCPQEGPNAVCVQYQAGAMFSMRQIHTRHIWQKPFHALYDHKPEGLDEAAYGMRGSYEVRIEPQSDGRSRLTITRAMPDLSLGAWSLFWLDDMARSEMDALQARLTGRRDWSLVGWSMRLMARAQAVS